MKKLMFLVCFLVFLPALNGQRSIDALFNKYSGKEGFVTLTFSGDILKLVSNFDNGLTESAMPAEITEIRMLIQEDKDMKAANFFDAVVREINQREYEEFMKVSKSDQELRMLARIEGNRFREFLLIAGGKDNLLIQIKGNMTRKEARKFSDEMQKNMD
ncbi:MAG: DUF4252 domain-containing protein [Bacteroidales bacterium]